MMNELTGELHADAQKLGGLSGGVPSLLNAQSLKAVRLEGNALTGPLPDLPPSVQDVRLSQNRLAGSIPLSYGQLPKLHTLKLEQNQLTGPIPTGAASGNLYQPFRHATRPTLQDVLKQLSCSLNYWPYVAPKGLHFLILLHGMRCVVPMLLLLAASKTGPATERRRVADIGKPEACRVETLKPGALLFRKRSAPGAPSDSGGGLHFLRMSHNLHVEGAHRSELHYLLPWYQAPKGL
jgi:hypothetical protein